MADDYHVSVMANECIDALSVRPDGLYLDCTLGGGGHSERILRKGGRIIGIDRDSDAIEYVHSRFGKISEFAGRYSLVHDNFKNAKAMLEQKCADKLDGAIIDLGISSRQVDDSARGFSYVRDGELDMRMDRDQVLSALSVVNEYSEQQLARIIFTYGEERFARRIAAAIVKQRKDAPIETTARLADIVVKAVPHCRNGHPAKKTFQAVRIEVNNELSGLGEAVCDIVDKLRVGARICVLTFHSLEDRIVKQTFQSLATDCICDKSLPVCVCGHKASVKLIGKALTPSTEETQINPRSRSAKLRVAEKV